MGVGWRRRVIIRKKKLDLVEERYAWKNFQWPIPAIGDVNSLISRWPRAALIKSLSDEIFTEFADDPGLVKVKHCRDVQEKCKRLSIPEQ